MERRGSATAPIHDLASTQPRAGTSTSTRNTPPRAELCRHRGI